jgi:hypothetical protein
MHINILPSYPTRPTSHYNHTDKKIHICLHFLLSRQVSFTSTGIHTYYSIFLISRSNSTVFFGSFSPSLESSNINPAPPKPTRRLRKPLVNLLSFLFTHRGVSLRLRSSRATSKKDFPNTSLQLLTCPAATYTGLFNPYVLDISRVKTVNSHTSGEISFARLPLQSNTT